MYKVPCTIAAAMRQSGGERAFRRPATDDLPVDPAVSTLIGVLLGGGIASGTSFRLERARADRERQAAEERERREARRAARLLAEELEYGRRLLARAQERGHYTWEPPRRLLPASAWTEYRADFALVSTDEQWASVATAFGEFDRLNWHVADVLEEDHWTGAAERRHPYFEPREVPPSADLDGAVGKVDAALAVLHGLMAD